MFRVLNTWIIIERIWLENFKYGIWSSFQSDDDREKRREKKHKKHDRESEERKKKKKDKKKKKSKEEKDSWQVEMATTWSFLSPYKVHLRTAVKNIMQTDHKLKWN